MNISLQFDFQLSQINTSYIISGPTPKLPEFAVLSTRRYTIHYKTIKMKNVSYLLDYMRYKQFCLHAIDRY